MDQAMINDLKEKLLEEERRLTQELELVESTGQGDTEQPVAFPQYGSKDDENAAEVATYSDSLSVSNTLGNTLEDVRAALQRMEKGTYGTCKYCEKPIPEKRLFARPASSSCVACKEKLKQGA